MAGTSPGHDGAARPTLSAQSLNQRHRRHWVLFLVAADNVEIDVASGGGLRLADVVQSLRRLSGRPGFGALGPEVKVFGAVAQLGAWGRSHDARVDEDRK